MSITTRELSGARASSAVICVTRAQHEAIGTPRDDAMQDGLKRYFHRGRKVGLLWARILRDDLIAQGRDPAELIVEDECAWGLGWVGHADLSDYGEKVVHEIYHAKGGAYREHKGWQAALYADSKGPEWRAELHVIDTSPDELENEDAGFSIQPYTVNVDGLRDRVESIKSRVIAAAQAGEWNPSDRVGTSPFDTECRSCVFARTCWDGWQPPEPDEVVGLEDLVEQYRIVDGDLAHASAKEASLKKQRDELRDAIRPYTRVGVPLDAGTGVTIRRTEVAGRISVKLGDFRKAGYEIPAELEPFVSESKSSERWKVDPA